MALCGCDKISFVLHHERENFWRAGEGCLLDKP